MVREGYVAECAATFDAAREKIGLFEYDCILLDIMLPDGSGLDLLRLLKSESVNLNQIVRDLASTLVVNLIKNSFAHNVEGGEVEIKIGADFIAFENNGRNIALDGEKIFDRFYQGGAKSGSYGLGLPIVQSICRLYGFGISYSYAGARHIFYVKLK